MNFEEFEGKFVSRNRKLWIALVFSICISSITLAISIWQDSYFVFSGGDIFKERPLAVHICKRGFESITSGEPHPYFVTKGIIDLLSDEKPFILDSSNIIKLSSVEKEKCKIILKDGNRLRSFTIGLVSNSSFPFFYKLNQIDEIEPTGEQR